MNNLKTLAAAVCLTAFGAAAPSVLAQATGAQQSQPAQSQGQAQQGMPSQQGMTAQQPTTKITDDELEKFVDASDKVFEIRDEFTEKLNGVEDPQEAQSLQMQAQQEMMEAVSDSGIEVQKYNEIATRLQSDTELQRRAQQLN